MIEPDRRRLLALVGVLLAIVAVAMAAASSPTIARVYPDPAGGPGPTMFAPTLATPSGAPPPPGDLVGLMSALPLILAFVLSLIVLVVLLRVRAAQRRPPGPVYYGEDPARGALVAGHQDPESVVADALDRLRAGATSGDEEIIRCWRALEMSGAALGVTRRSTETVGEYVHDLSSATTMDEDALGELARLYRAAVYSGRSSTTVDQDIAVACLARLTADQGQR